MSDDEVRCARCQRVVPASDAVEGSTLDGDLLGFFFCAQCADDLAEPPAYPREKAA